MVSSYFILQFASVTHFLISIRVSDSLHIETLQSRLDLESATNSYVILSILKHYKGWDFVYHVDESLHTYETLLYHFNENPQTLFNYNSTQSMAFVRPPVQRCVNIASLTNTLFLEYAQQEENIDEMDVIIFLTTQINIAMNYSHLYVDGVDYANTVCVVDSTSAVAFFFYSSPESVPSVREVHTDEDGIPQVHEYKNNFEDFYGHPLHIGYTNCPPFVYDYGEAIIGIEFEVLKILSQKLNITPVMDNFSDKENARNTLIKAVNKSELDFGIGCLSNNAIRNEMVAFSSSIQLEPHITVFASVNGRYGAPVLYAIISPLQLPVWIGCGVTMIVLSLIAKFLVLAHPCKQDVPINAALMPTKILLEQATAIPSYSDSLRFALLTWILIGFVLSSIYKSKLTAALIMPASNEPATLEKLFEEGYHFISPATDSTYLVEVLKYSHNPVENNIGNSIEDTKLMCEAVERILRELSAIIEERSVIRYQLWYDCYKNMTEQEIVSLRRLPEDTTVNGHVWAMPKAAPYKAVVTSTLERMKSHGLIDKWYKAYNLSEALIHSNARVHTERVPLTPHALASAWILITLGMTISGAVFFVELMTKRTKATASPSANSKVHMIPTPMAMEDAE